ncbi:MAG: cysteine--tRNA ligase [Brevinema sp.]
MAIHLYNSMTKKTESLLQKKTISIYSCGPTVYDYAHIGNMRTFLFEDLLIRSLKVLGFNVDHVRNLTDVDDKTITCSIEQGLSLSTFTQKYTDIFFENLQQLNVDQSTTRYLKATEYIDKMILLIEQLIIKGFAYVKDDGVYFKISSFKDYGNFQGLDLEHIEQNISVNNNEFSKEEYGDFVIWKKYKQSDGDIFWSSPWGNGRPGWHTECAAMVYDCFADGVDIHTGGIDLLFPHHTNEKAHCECLSNKPMATFWLHATHLLVDNKKMSKSLGNFYTIKDLQDKGFSNRVIRFYLMTGAHYQTPLNFTIDGLKGADSALKRINNFIQEIKEHNTDCDIPKVSHHLKEKFLTHLEDNLNISAAMGEIFSLINNYYQNHDINISEVLSDLNIINSVLGVLEIDSECILDEKTQILFDQRVRARQEKNWKESDRLRDKLLDLGIEVRDTKEGTTIRKI